MNTNQLKRFAREARTKLLQQVGVLDHPALLGHCNFATDEDLEIIRRYPAGIAQAPKTYMKHGVGLGPVVKFLQKAPVGWQAMALPATTPLIFWSKCA